jgi:uncharacterized repeat protein (TIGR03803 family)
MNHLRRIVGACFSAVLLAACGGAANGLFPTTHTSLASLGAAPDDESVLYYFRGHRRADGSNPDAGLIAINGTLYGTTIYGGGEKSCRHKLGCGTVFEISTSGVEQVLYRFKDAPDGDFPSASLLSVKGVLYGTTEFGGESDSGVVFALNRSTGAESVVYSFKGQNAEDGSRPHTLIAEKGVLYGTTGQGGGEQCGTSNAHGCGTVFEVTTAGRERVLHVFKGGGDDQNRDGGYPSSGLTSMNGMLYGTTAGGGRYPKHPVRKCLSGCGTVFEISPSGDQYRVLYRFKGGKDGANPDTSLVEVNGKLYGTTSGGGGVAVCGALSKYTCGTIFEVSTSGTERIVHRFDRLGGAFPNSLVAVNDTLYGTTSAGGPNGCLNYGCGTVFKISPTGRGYNVLHVFSAPPDGLNPVGNLVHLNGALYGTTSQGGKQPDCYYPCPGTVFKLTP